MPVASPYMPGCEERSATRRKAGLNGERARLRTLERENKELQRASEILRRLHKASAFFPQAELDRYET